MTKELIEQYANIDYPDNKTMNDYIKKSLFDVVKLSNGMLCGFEKSHINTRFCFRDEGADYELYKELHKDNDRMKNYFLNENTWEIDRMIEVFEDKDEHKIPAIYDYENGLCKPSWYYWADHRDTDNTIRVTEDDQKAILEKLYEVRKSLIKRLETWWKKYGAEKLHTWTYWADA